MNKSLIKTTLVTSLTVTLVACKSKENYAESKPQSNSVQIESRSTVQMLTSLPSSRFAPWFSKKFKNPRFFSPVTSDSEGSPSSLNWKGVLRFSALTIDDKVTLIQRTKSSTISGVVGPVKGSIDAKNFEPQSTLLIDQLIIEIDGKSIEFNFGNTAIVDPHWPDSDVERLNSHVLIADSSSSDIVYLFPCGDGESASIACLAVVNGKRYAITLYDEFYEPDIYLEALKLVVQHPLVR